MEERGESYDIEIDERPPTLPYSLNQTGDLTFTPHDPTLSLPSPTNAIQRSSSSQKRSRRRNGRQAATRVMIIGTEVVTVADEDADLHESDDSPTDRRVAHNSIPSPLHADAELLQSVHSTFLLGESSPLDLPLTEEFEA